MKHILKIKGENVELSTAEAKRLLEELKEAFGETHPMPVLVPQPYPVFPPPEQYPPWIITCESQPGIRTPCVFNPMIPTLGN